MAGTPTRPGDANIVGTPLLNFLKLFVGEVLSAYSEVNVMEDIVQVRTITSGKSAQFINTAKASAVFHTAGVNIIEGTLTSNIATNERVIFVDNKLISALLLDTLDEAMAHWDVRGVLARELGRAISKRFDQLAINTALLAARAVSNLTAGAGIPINGGASVIDVNVGTSGQALINSLFSAAQILDQNDVPKDGRYAVISPAMFYNLIRDPSVQLLYMPTDATHITLTNPGTFTSTASTLVTTGTNSQFQSQYPMVQQGLADWGSGTLRGAAVAGFTVLVSNHVPSTNILAGDAFFGTGAASSNGNVYYGNFSTTKGVAFHREAIGVVKLRSLGVETDYKIEYQAHLIVAKMICGMGVLRPECAVELKTS